MGMDESMIYFLFATLTCAEDLWDSIHEWMEDVGLFSLAEQKLRKDGITTSKHYLQEEKSISPKGQCRHRNALV